MSSNVCLSSFYPHYLPTDYYYYYLGEVYKYNCLGFLFLLWFILFFLLRCLTQTYVFLPHSSCWVLKCRHYIQLSSQSCALEANIDMLICGACILRRRRFRSRREIHSTGVCRLRNQGSLDPELLAFLRQDRDTNPAVRYQL